MKECNLVMKSVYTWYNSNIKIGIRHKICTIQFFFWCTRTTGGHRYVSTGVLISVLRLIWKTYSCTDFPKYQGLILKKSMEVQELFGVTRFSYLNKIIFDLLEVFEKIVLFYENRGYWKTFGGGEGVCTLPLVGIVELLA